MKNILHVIHSMNPDTGGPAETVRALMSFRAMGYFGEVVCLDDPTSPFLGKYPFSIVALGNGFTSLGISLRLERWLATNGSRFNGVVVHGLWRYTSFAVWKTLNGQVPYVLFTHGMLDPYFKRRYPLKHVKKWVYWLFFEYRVLRDAKHVLFTTNEESVLAKETFWLHRWNALVVPYGASSFKGDTGAAVDMFFRDHPALFGKRFLLFLGRVDRKKGCDMLVRGFINNAGNDENLHLAVAGPDKTGWWSLLEEEVNRAGLSSRVHRIGVLSKDDKWGAFLACEAFVLTSHQENFGIAVAESLGCGRVVLISDRVNIASQILRDSAGFVQPDTQDGTNKLILDWIHTPQEQRQAMSLNAVRCFEANFQLENTVRALLEMF